MVIFTTLNSNLIVKNSHGNKILLTMGMAIKSNGSTTRSIFCKIQLKSCVPGVLAFLLLVWHPSVFSGLCQK